MSNFLSLSHSLVCVQYYGYIFEEKESITQYSRSIFYLKEKCDDTFWCQNEVDRSLQLHSTIKSTSECL